MSTPDLLRGAESRAACSGPLEKTAQDPAAEQNVDFFKDN